MEDVPAELIEPMVGRKRHATEHFATVTSASEIYILHSQECLDLLGAGSLYMCRFSIAYDQYGLVAGAVVVDHPFRAKITHLGDDRYALDQA